MSPSHTRSHRVARVVSCSLLLVVALLLDPEAVLALESFEARCVAVLDGDSIRVLRRGDEIEVRLDGIDAPEHRQAFADRAKEALSALVYGKEVEVSRVATDNYGRYVSDVFVGELNVNLEMVRRGLAWHYKRYSKDPKLEAAEATARARRAGLWVDPAAVPPWSFRRKAVAARSSIPQSRTTQPGTTQPPTTQVRGPTPTIATAGEVHGNISSRVYHTSSCPNFSCQNCIASFENAAAAEARGYKPAGDCHPASR